MWTKNIFRKAGKKVFALLSITFLTGLMEGIGVMMLIPMLSFIGITGEKGGTSGINMIIAKVFEFLTLPSTLISVLAVYVVIASFQKLLLRMQAVVSSDVNLTIVRELRNHLFSLICNAKWAFLSGIRSSDFTHSLTVDINQISNGVNTIIRISYSTVMFLAYFAMALYLSPVIASSVAASGLLAVLALKRKTFSTRKTGQQQIITGRELQGMIVEHLGSMKLSKIHCLEKRIAQRFEKVTEDAAQNMRNHSLETSGTNMWFGIFSIFLLAFFVYLAVEVIKVPTDSILLLAFIFIRLIPLIGSLQQYTQQTMYAFPSIESYQKMEKQCREAAEAFATEGNEAISISEKVQLEDISFQYKSGSKPAIDSASFTIKANETTAIIGPSGAGKSTLADLLMGLIEPQKGRVLVDGKPLTSQNLRAWRNAVTYVPQENFLFHDTVRGNISWVMPEATEEEVLAALELAAARDFVLKLPDGLDTVIGERGIKLSGGERQRLALARALLLKPELLILDEATSSLDHENEQRIKESIESLHGNLTIIIIAHRYTTIQNADLIVSLEKGKVIRQGTWDETFPNLEALQ